MPVATQSVRTCLAVLTTTTAAVTAVAEHHTTHPCPLSLPPSQTPNTHAGYVKNVQEFVARGLQVTRCPTTQRLRVSKPDEYLPSAAAAAAAAGMLVSPRGAGGRGNNSSSNGGGGGNECGHIASNGGGVVGEHGEDDSVFVTPPSFSFGSSPSEIMSGINSINLAESIARHNQWAATAAAAASAITATATPADKAAAAAAATAAVAASGGGGVVRAQADSDGEEAAA